jgi:hypothetical protein
MRYTPDELETKEEKEKDKIFEDLFRDLEFFGKPKTFYLTDSPEADNPGNPLKGANDQHRVKELANKINKWLEQYWPDFIVTTTTTNDFFGYPKIRVSYKDKTRESWYERLSR